MKFEISVNINIYNNPHYSSLTLMNNTQLNRLPTFPTSVLEKKMISIPQMYATLKIINMLFR